MQKYYFYEWLVVVVCKLFLLDVCCQSNLGEMRDYFKGDELELLCTHHRVGNQGRNTMWRFTSYNRRIPVKNYSTGDWNYENIEVHVQAESSRIQVSSLMVNNSGHYECVNGQNVFCFWKINVHDPNEMVYVMTSRGQKPWEDTEVNEYSVILEWTEWTECDGCAGDGERRKFGFCFVTWEQNKIHCSATKEIPILLRPIAKRRREEIIVDICYDHCIEYEEPSLIEEQRVDVANGADVTLTCVEKAEVTSPIRWEREGEVLKRSDVSFGYAKSQPMYVSRSNLLILRSIDLPLGGVISITCVQDRKRRSRFNLYIQPLVDVNTVEFQDHLFWIGASSAVQIIAFLLLLFVYISLENFATLISKQAGYHSIPDKDYESLAESENDS